MTTITFLGTGGGRFATIYQVRSTGGIYVNDGTRLHIDPGPSALMNLSRLSLDPARTDAVLISHCHPDHYADAEMLIEGMTKGGFKRSGTLVGSESVLRGSTGFSPAISEYHRSIAGKVIVVKAGDRFEIGQVKITATPTMHSDPTGVGFRLSTSAGDISYVGDTELTDALIAPHQGCRVLILNVTRPLKSRVPKHLSTEDAAVLIKKVHPEVAILTHFGMKLIHDGVDKQVEYIERSSGVRTIPAEDLMTIQLGKSIRAERFHGKEISEDSGKQLSLDI